MISMGPAGGAVRHARRLAGGQGGGTPVVRLGLGLSHGGGRRLAGLLDRALGPLGYLLPILLLTAGYALFQTANNSAVVGRRRGEPWRRGRSADPVAQPGPADGAAGLGPVRRPGGGAADLALATADELAFATRPLRPDGLLRLMSALWLAEGERAVQGDVARDGCESGER